MLEHDVRLTRRSLLATGLAGLGGMTLLYPHAAWAGKRWPKFRFTIISDTHLGIDDNDLAAQNLARAAAEIGQDPGAFVLHLGDIVDAGREAQFPVYQQIRPMFRAPVYEIPGNQDPQPLFEQYVRTPVDTAFDHKGVRFLLFNNSRFNSHRGHITPEQIAWLEAQCADAAQRGLFLVFCTHVPVHTNSDPDRGWYVQPENGQTEFYALLDRYQDRALALLHGHFHYGLRGWEDRAPTHEIVAPSALYNRDANLMALGAPGYNLPDFRPGYLQAQFKEKKLILRYKPIGAPLSVQKKCSFKTPKRKK